MLSFIRPRRVNRLHAFAAVGAITVAGLAGAQLTQGAATPVEQSAFVPITPCRLLDTRPDPDRVGTLATFSAGQTQVADVRGINGECNIPVSATGVAANVTALNGSAPSFLQLWPAGATQPRSSNLNWLPGQAPTPNKVDIGLSAQGQMSIFNLNGTVDVIVDVVGYYSPIASATGTVQAVQIAQAQITMALNSNGGGTNGNAVAQCPTDFVAIAGGVEGPAQVPLNTRTSRPEPLGNNPTGWFGDMRSSSESTVGQVATVYAVCIRLSTS
jgi:hypothetical protein